MIQEWLKYIEGNYDWMMIGYNCVASLRRVMAGVCIAIIVGIAMGLFRSSLPIWIKSNKLVRFLLDAPKFPPPIAWIPFITLAFGIGELSAYVIVFIGAFSPIFTNAYEGSESVPQIIRDIGHSLEVRGIKFLLLIIFPAALPQILTGIRIGISMGWMAIIAGEMISGQSGLGYSIQLNRLNLQYDLMVLDMILIACIGFLLYTGTAYVERKILVWHERSIY